jgi:hypothetical protein
MPDAPLPGQSQTQQQLITINLESSGDPELERRLLNGRHGVGRQLGELSAVVEVLLAAHEKGAAPAEADAAVEKFKKAQAEIRREKRLRERERLLQTLEKVQRLERAEARDVEEARKAIRALRDWLATYEAELPGGG